MENENEVRRLRAKLAKYEKFVEDFWNDLTRDEYSGLDFVYGEDTRNILKERFWHFRAEMSE